MNRQQLLEQAVRPAPLFKTMMIQAILLDYKLMTRRPIKEQPHQAALLARDPGAPSGWSFIHDTCDDQLLTCPYGKPGDILWVKETWRPAWCHTEHFSGPGVRYRADNLVLGRVESNCTGIESDKWKSSMMMPKWAARIFIQIESVQIERLQDISEIDAQDEGLTLFNEDGNVYFSGLTRDQETWFDEPELWHCDDPVAAFKDLWTSINSIESWLNNPWVWVIKFRRLM